MDKGTNTDHYLVINRYYYFRETINLWTPGGTESIRRGTVTVYLKVVLNEKQLVNNLSTKYR